MLREHLAQDHDMASRRFARIDRHTNWIHEHVLSGKPSRILDLACGPGFYGQRLAELGHSVRGIDFGPASIEYARNHQPEYGEVEYVLDDLRTVEFGRDYDVVMFVYGEFNVFPRSDAEKILARSFQALRVGGKLLIEAHTLEQVERTGCEENTWFKGEWGLFSDKPHLCLVANYWFQERRVAVTEFIVVDTTTADAEKYINALQGYTHDEYRSLLRGAGFDSIRVCPAWGKQEFTPEDQLLFLRATKP
jgi:SAM-dependent methyltransferase